MNVRILLATATIAALPAAALAQDPNASDTAGEPGYGTLIASLQASDKELAELEALEGVALADIQVVFVGEVVAGESAALDEEIEKN